MIARLIDWCARNLLLVFFGAGFAAAAGFYALMHLPLDAIPDLSDTQVIVYTEYPGQAPQVIEDQVTYPLTTAMLTVPRSKVARGFSFFGVSFVYVIFEDGTDLYWARSRVLEFLNSAASRLPAGVAPTIGPDATGVGWVYQYAVMSKELNLSDTRTIQDWNLKFALAKAEGVAEVVDAFQIALAANDIFEFGELDGAAADIGVAGADRIAHLLHGDAEIAHALRIEDDVVLADEAADACDLGHAFGLGEREFQVPVLDRAGVRKV